ncbi:MAG: hypothetical protein OXG68_16820 [Chloroflexi bacterium]|nr:hypothetical protein [Chloroflexota bacterium]
MLWLDAAVVNRELGKVGEDANGGVSRPAIGAQLLGWFNRSADVYCGFFRLNIKGALRSGEESIIRVFDAAAAPQSGFVQYLFAKVPTQCAEEGIDKLLSELRLVVIGVHKFVSVFVEVFDQLFDAVGRAHELSSVTSVEGVSAGCVDTNRQTPLQVLLTPPCQSRS